MIVYIHVQLSRWGRLSERGFVSGLGHRKAAPYTRLVPAAAQNTEMSDLWDLDRCVERLADDERRLVTLHYVQGWAMAAIAKELGCCRDTCYYRLHQVHVRILGWLQDMAAGCFDERSEKNA